MLRTHKPHFRIVPLTPSNMQTAKNLVAECEPYCVPLAEALRTGKENLFALEVGGQMAGVLRPAHTLLHCIPHPCEGMKVPLAKFFADRARQGHKTQCINGERDATSFIEGILSSMGQIPQQTNHYLLMSLSAPPPPIDTPPICEAAAMTGGFAIVYPECTKETADALMPLQEAYQKEEVIPACRTFHAAAARLTLEKDLKERRVAVLMDAHGGIAAKASINAAGINCAGLGGVYTAPRWRRCGLARFLVSSVASSALRTFQRIVLYVREENTSAIGLYQGLGMQTIGNFEIVYY